ncbi:GNAT family N-acetyltransferase [Pontibacter kalidii]|uniref:GNAT family N-acetyltransferase n=1 Tax=Pontibacter kalidii TaxID=2592049 RepID=UPI00225BE8CD|nr:GNAT family N-acetyltransferase [Pontibacter kalidii]
MLQFKIRALAPDEPPPMQLLLLADPSEEIIFSYLHQSHTFVAEHATEIVGALVFQLQDNSTAEIMNVAVEEDWQGKGIGRQLVAYAIDLARQQSIKRLFVCTGNSTLPALALYKRCGFTIESIDKGYFLRNYPQPIFENGLQCTDRVKLRLEL